ncbi:hypothetical protein CAPTEDRAFT_201999 [Capitella teleta]|uniref:Uncharacterized protein n=1 Tax=Capitella teleta TaxID=283909 RepID=R7TGI3_CAPTE|nr:hypothetical protein CAPTEDRAFT_201999 [Capitella teleta]|eukprot:ELT90225.1 hypothetical protein CAPTEDRAFT_201999 [Capitella teleta]
MTTPPRTALVVPDNGSSVDDNCDQLECGVGAEEAGQTTPFPSKFLVEYTDDEDEGDKPLVISEGDSIVIPESNEDRDACHYGEDRDMDCTSDAGLDVGDRGDSADATHQCSGYTCNQPGFHFRESSSCKERADDKGMREIGVKRKMVMADFNPHMLTDADHAEVLLIQAQEKTQQALRLIKASIDAVVLENMPVHGRCKGLSVAAQREAYEEQEARWKATMDFVRRHTGELDMSLWGLDSVIGFLLGEAHLSLHQKDMHFDYNRRYRRGAPWTMARRKAWIDKVGTYKCVWQPYMLDRATLTAELMMICNKAGLSRYMWHRTINDFDALFEDLLSNVPKHLFPPRADDEDAFLDDSYRDTNRRLTWRLRVVAFAILYQAQPSRLIPVLSFSYLAKCVRYFSCRRKRTDEAMPDCPSEDRDYHARDTVRVFVDRVRSEMSAEEAEIMEDAERMLEQDASDVPDIKCIARLIEETFRATRYHCINMARVPTIADVADEVMSMTGSRNALVPVEVILAMYAMKGHHDELAYGSNQEDVHQHYIFPCKAQIAAGIVAVGRVRIGPVLGRELAPWDEMCIKNTGFDRDTIQPIAHRMHELTCSHPRVPYTWKDMMAVLLQRPKSVLDYGEQTEEAMCTAPDFLRVNTDEDTSDYFVMRYVPHARHF